MSAFDQKRTSTHLTHSVRPNLSLPDSNTVFRKCDDSPTDLIIVGIGFVALIAMQKFLANVLAVMITEWRSSHGVTCHHHYFHR
jgi:hypothetical protein